jgi:8-oxo-dGTP pyrophosphatase MutT (NUDIX family)
LSPSITFTSQLNARWILPAATPDERMVQQAAAIPFCRRDDGVYLCLIRRRDSKYWGIPKGFVDPGDTREETALNEAWEEAGLRGELVGEAIGTYQYVKFRSKLTVAVYVMEVHAEEADWQESRLRQRQWHPLDEALTLLSGHPVQPLLPLMAAMVRR